MDSTTTVTVEDIPLTPETPSASITPGRRIRLIRITPVCLTNLTGTTQALPDGSRSKTRFDVLLDESSTQALRQDHRVDNTTRIDRPAPNIERFLLHGIPTICMLLAENDS
ncbi:hypothetical protein AB0D84_27700 [Streptomyces sp. NPDC048193]|uniref:hypothetical protein n=1 Tax=unclassified Streptomyces TaxID=2593676 RepID=UPI00342C78C8